VSAQAEGGTILTQDITTWVDTVTVSAPLGADGVYADGAEPCLGDAITSDA
jgi:hypothetical protein